MLNLAIDCVLDLKPFVDLYYVFGSHIFLVANCISLNFLDFFYWNRINMLLLLDFSVVFDYIYNFYSYGSITFFTVAKGWT